MRINTLVMLEWIGLDYNTGAVVDANQYLGHLFNTVLPTVIKSYCNNLSDIVKPYDEALSLKIQHLSILMKIKARIRW